MCLKGKHHNKFEREIATVNKMLTRQNINFEYYKDADIVKKLMIDKITMDNKSCFPRKVFERMPLKEVLVIYRELGEANVKENTKQTG